MSIKQTYEKEVTYDKVTIGTGEGEVEEIREAIKGWNIVEVGKTYGYTWDKDHRLFPNHKSRVEGGLTLLLEKEGKKRTVIIGYTELGEWLEASIDTK